jgi:hypothetical protein
MSTHHPIYWLFPWSLSIFETWSMDILFASFCDIPPTQELFVISVRVGGEGAER